MPFWSWSFLWILLDDSTKPFCSLTCTFIPPPWTKINHAFIVWHFLKGKNAPFCLHFQRFFHLYGLEIGKCVVQNPMFLKFPSLYVFLTDSKNMKYSNVVSQTNMFINWFSKNKCKAYLKFLDFKTISKIEIATRKKKIMFFSFVQFIRVYTPAALARLKIYILCSSLLASYPVKILYWPQPKYIIDLLLTSHNACYIWIMEQIILGNSERCFGEWWWT